MIGKKSSGKLIAKGAVALLVAGVLTAGVCCMGYASRGDDGKWFGNGDVKSWHWTDKAKPDETDPKEDENLSMGIGGAVVSTGENNGMSLLCAELPRAAYAANGIAEQSENAYLLTVNITPENATIEGYEWTVSFKDSVSEWAADKTISDYITLTPNGATASFAVLQAFGEQIIITVTPIETTSEPLPDEGTEGEELAAQSEEQTATEEQGEGTGEEPIMPAKKFATYTVDYAQKFYLTNFLIGSVRVPLASHVGEDSVDGWVNIVLSDTGGKGGQIASRIAKITDQPYTLAEAITTENLKVEIVTEESVFEPKQSMYFQPSFSEDMTGNVLGKSIYFDLRLFNSYGHMSNTGTYESFSTVFKLDSTTWEPTYAVEKCFLTFQLTVEGQYSTIKQKVRLLLNDYTIPVDLVEIEEGSGTIV